MKLYYDKTKKIFMENFMKGSSLLYVTRLPGLVALGLVVVKIKCF